MAKKTKIKPPSHSLPKKNKSTHDKILDLFKKIAGKREEEKKGEK